MRTAGDDITAKAKFCFDEVEVDGHSARLTYTEHEILQALVDASPQSVTTTLLARYCTRSESRDSVRMHVASIRRKLEENDVPLTIEHRWGFGYRCVF